MLSIHVSQLRSGSRWIGDQKHLPIESSQIKPFVVTKIILFRCMSRLRNTNWHINININIMVTLNIFCILRHIQTNIIEKNIIISLVLTRKFTVKPLVTLFWKYWSPQNANSSTWVTKIPLNLHCNYITRKV